MRRKEEASAGGPAAGFLSVEEELISFYDSLHKFSCIDDPNLQLQWEASSLRQREGILASSRVVAGRKWLERELIEAGDREKERIGRELHDGLCQNLAGVAALSATLTRKLAARNDPKAASAAEITALLQQAIRDAMNLARGLNPSGLSQMGLAAALELLAANVEALHLVSCSFASDRHFPRLDSECELHLYRIAQEAVHNAFAHGRGNRIGISLRVRDGRGCMRIRDNGVGISRGAAAVGHGIGLNSMDVRARLIRARLRVQRAKPRGTIVVCAFPLSSPTPKERLSCRGSHLSAGRGKTRS